MLGGKLRALRQKNGWTQKQIAEMLHINRSTYAYYETGATQPDLDMFRRLAILFEVSTDDLLGLSTPMLDMEAVSYTHLQGDIRQHVHRRFKHIQFVSCPHPMKAVGWPTAGHIALVAANGSPLVGVSGHTVFVHADTYGVVVDVYKRQGSSR